MVGCHLVTVLLLLSSTRKSPVVFGLFEAKLCWPYHSRKNGLHCYVKVELDAGSVVAASSRGGLLVMYFAQHVRSIAYSPVVAASLPQTTCSPAGLCRQQPNGPVWTRLLQCQEATEEMAPPSANCMPTSPPRGL